ncbi:MAG: MtrB/PioB family outer membrane beta-barrel protein [Burkholderiaceae bacterium]
MNRTLIAILVANAFALPALAQDKFQLIEGSVGVGGLYTQERNTKDAAKLHEYQDLNNGAAGYFDLHGRSDTYWLKGYGENIGRDDLYVDLKGGMYDMFKARVYSNWLTHNFGFAPATGSRYQGAGTANQTATFAPPVVPPFFASDYSYNRRVTGGEVEWKTTSPWYVRADANSVQFDGNKLFAAAQGTSPGNGFVDLAGPVDYKTDNLMLEGGYAAREMLFNVAVLWSKFDNANTSFNWNNGYFRNGVDTTYSAPNNDFFKVSANGALRKLPLNSQLSGRFTYATSESNFALATQALNGTGGQITASNPNVPNFNGKEKNTTASLAWTALPARGVDTKAYYNYYDRANESTHVVFSPPTVGLPGGGNLACGGQPCTAEFYSVTKNNFGVEGAWRFMAGNRIAGGWDYLHTDQERHDFDKVTDNKLWAEWRNSAIEDVNLRLKYQYSWRRSDFLLANAGANAQDPNYLTRYAVAFDSADRDQNLIKAVIDFSPVPFVDLSLEGIYKNNDYKTTVLGRTKDTRQEIYGSIAFGAPQSIRTSFFGDYETVKYDSYHRAISNLTATGAYDPNASATSQNYNWASQNTEHNWLLGAAVAVPVTEALKLTGSLMYTKNSGGADFQSQNNFGTPIPITAYDNYKQSSFNLRGDWRITRSFELTGGYAYQKYDYSDFQYNNYQLLAPPAPSPVSTTTSYLSGVGATPQYSANIFYMIGKYRF